MDKHASTQSTGRLITGNMTSGLKTLLLLLAIVTVAQCGKCYPRLLLFAFAGDNDKK